MCKKIVYIMLGLLGLILFIFFFPIKMAVDEGDVESYDDLEGYFITPTDATGGFWYTNDTKEGEIYFINLSSVVLLTAELRKGSYYDTTSHSTGLRRAF